MERIKTVLEKYKYFIKLKDLPRTGWETWNVQRKRRESVGEHVYATIMLAEAMYYAFNYDVDIYKVVFMLANHEIGEPKIGDFNPFQISREEKEKIEHAAVHELFQNFKQAQPIEDAFLEFDAKLTKEAKFAFQCDKLECDLQAAVYDQEGCIDLNNLQVNNATENERVQKLLNSGDSWSHMWIKYDIDTIPYDENFLSVLNYVLENGI